METVLGKFVGLFVDALIQSRINNALAAIPPWFGL